MSSSQDFPGDRRRSYDKAPEKSNFAQTCNRLSQYLREKGSLRDLGLGIASKLEIRGSSETPHFTSTARNLFPKMEKLDISEQRELMNLFPQQAEVGRPIHTDNTTSSKSAMMETESKTAQMTIFYDGQVLVFDNFPADKAGELFLFADKESYLNSDGFFPTSTIGAENIKSDDSDLPNPRTNIRLQPQTQAIGSSDFPIMRRPSLHRFVDKRKDRVAARAPYLAHGSASTSSSKSGEDLDLNL